MGLDIYFAVCEARRMNVETIRKELDLKPEEFARALGISSGYAGDLRSGRRKPSLRVVAKLQDLTARPLVADYVAEKTAETN